jgi:hypothetical protein
LEALRDAAEGFAILMLLAWGGNASKEQPWRTNYNIARAHSRLCIMQGIRIVRRSDKVHSSGNYDFAAYSELSFG